MIVWGIRVVEIKENLLFDGELSMLYSGDRVVVDRVVKF